MRTKTWLLVDTSLLHGLAEHAIFDGEPTDQILERVLRTVAGHKNEAIPGWHHSGVFLAEGTRLKFIYNKDEYRGKVIGTELTFDNIKSEMPSKVVMDAINERSGQEVNLNGWNYIQAEQDGDWIALKELRSIAARTMRLT